MGRLVKSLIALSRLLSELPEVRASYQRDIVVSRLIGCYLTPLETEFIAASLKVSSPL